METKLALRKQEKLTVAEAKLEATRIQDENARAEVEAALILERLATDKERQEHLESLTPASLRWKATARVLNAMSPEVRKSMLPPQTSTSLTLMASFGGERGFQSSSFREYEGWPRHIGSYDR